MIVVDSSVWIDALRSRPPVRLTELLSSGRDTEVIVGDLIVHEVLRGARNDRHAAQLERGLREFKIVRMLNERVAIQAASYYRHLRGLGITIRTVPDLIIGTYCIEHGHELMQRDRDFSPMVEHLGLRLYAG